MSATIVLADTNIISEFVKKTPDVNVMRWLQTVQSLAISAVTYGNPTPASWRCSMRW